MKTVVSLEHDPSVYANCNELTIYAPMRWLRKGWQDFRRSLSHSLTYGALFTAIGWLLVYFAQSNESFFLLGLFISVLILGPALAFGLYDISQQLERNQELSFSHERKKAFSEMGHELMLSLMLSLVFLAMLIFTSMVMGFGSTLSSGVAAAVPMSETTFFVVAVVFAGLLFCANSFALPMILDQDANAAKAVTTSLNAVWRNKQAMAVWALLILALTAVGFATALIGFVMIVPVLGYASWHAYREAIIRE